MNDVRRGTRKWYIGFQQLKLLGKFKLSAEAPCIKAVARVTLRVRCGPSVPVLVAMATTDATWVNATLMIVMVTLRNLTLLQALASYQDPSFIDDG